MRPTSDHVVVGFGVEHVGVDPYGRSLFLTTLAEDWQWLDPEVDRFVLFVGAVALLAWEQLLAYARASVAAGCAYVCCWGSGCERIHDAFDQASGDEVVFSTWHDNESLAEALYFAEFLTYLDPEEVGRAEVAVVVAVQPSWQAQTRALLEDQEELVRQFVGDDY